MEQGVGNWKLKIARRGREITILRGVTCDAKAVVPDELFGLPVTVLGDHALSPTAWDVDGEEVEVSCGTVPPEAVWDNRGIRELSLPRSIRRMEDYALLNCDSLEKLELYDDIRFWGGGALMNCRMLHRFELHRTGEQGENLAYFTDELSRELDVVIRETDGRTTHLVFPEYLEVYEENCPAHHFDYVIVGAGYPYHHCFHHKVLNLKNYDALWPVYLGMEHDEDTAMRLAWYRLHDPTDLTEKAAEAYLQYLKTHAPQALLWLLSQRDYSGLHDLLQWTQPDEATFSAACEAARRQGAAEALAVLLEEQHQRFSRGMDKDFDL